ncbi:MAG: hypothetical protein JWO62_269 [Acidimicrobiaceae bacterium]|nr:hypothetical protein [Acidimicrobiaceae bacterium]
MRIPEEIPRRPRSRRRGIWLLVLLAVLVVLLVVVQGLAGFYTNFLWFHWSGFGAIWRTVTATKVVLGAVFVVLAFVLLSTTFWLVDKIAPRAMFMAPDSDLVRRYQAIVGPHALVIRNVVAFFVALILGTGTAAQWQHWLLFEHAVPFGSTDPLFHRDESFFVFRLPFLSFLVDWILVALLVAFLLSAIGHFLNGAIRFQGSPRIEPRALAHLSLLLGFMALVRAWAYYYVDRFTLDLSNNGYVRGAGYTDVHVRLPAITLLSVVSLVAFVLLIVNVYQRTWVLPLVAFGLWVFLALVVGVIYPAVVQAFRVTPAQSSLELPYIARNIAATKYAMGLAEVGTPRSFPANQDLTAQVLKSYQQTLDDAVLWDPNFASPTFDKLQDVHSYYKISALAVDRYNVGGQVEPTVVGVRELQTSALPTQTWVNTHLQYTHGYGVVAAQANSATSNGTPVFKAGNLPPTASSSSLALRQPSVFYAPGQSQYVVVDTAQPEVDYQKASANQTSNGKGSGGVPVGSLLTRAAYAIHLRDFNLLVSNLITSRSRIIPVTNVRAAVAKALPFLQVDAHPYAVVANGQLYWMVDAYTTTNYYPYGQTAMNGSLPSGTGLAGTYDYVRDAVKVVMNAQSGQMQFYTVDANGDPLIESYERAFPGLFHPISQMNSVLRQHLRYPQDLLMEQAATYGRYHVKSSEASLFYSESAAWDLSETSTSIDGRPSNQLQTNPDGTVASFVPVYEQLQLPGEQGPTFNALEPLVPFSPSGKIQTLKALLVADSSAAGYGRLESFVTPTDVSINGPAYANSEINSNTTVSKQITLLGQGGSIVQLGAVQILPIADSLLYVRPLYVSSTQTQLPTLADVVVEYGQEVVMAPTLDQALAQVFGTSVGGSSPTSGNGGGSGGGSTESAAIPTQVRKLIAAATSKYGAAKAALSNGDLGQYQADVQQAGQDLVAAKKLLDTPAAKLKPASAKSTPAHTTSSSSASVTSSRVKSPPHVDRSSVRQASAPSTTTTTQVPTAASRATLSAAADA